MRSMTATLLRSIPRVAAGVVLATGPAFAQESKPAEEATTSVFAVAGGQYRNDLDRGLARFNEFREIRKGGVLEFGRLFYEPKGSQLTLSFTVQNALQDHQRYVLALADPAKLRFRASYVERPRFYSSGSRTLWSGVGTGNLTLDPAFRQGAEAAFGSPTAPFASPSLETYMRSALAGASAIDLKTKRKDLGGVVDLELTRALTLSVNGRYEMRGGTRPLGFGTYIRRQALVGVPDTGAGSFWRETIEPRGNELVEPLDYKTTEVGATLTWAQNGHSASAGWFGSRFRNDIPALFFDSPFEGPLGRASATIFDPRSDQEPAAPNGNNNLRGLYARSATQLWPANDYNRLFGSVSIRVAGKTRLNLTAARGRLAQDEPFLPYAENDQVVFSGVAGQPNAVYAKNAPLPRSSLDGKMDTTQADLKVTSRLTDALSVRAAYRFYDLDDRRPQILFPGYSSAGDAYFRAGIGQRDAAGNRLLFNVIGGYTRKRLDLGAAFRFGALTLDGEYRRTGWDYEARQVDRTADDTFRGTVRFVLGPANLNAFYLRASRDFEGRYDVGLETSGVRAFDVWTRNRDQLGLDVDLPVRDDIALAVGASYGKDEYPGAVSGFTYGYGLQDSKSGSLYAGLNYSRNEWLLGAWAGYDHYAWNSLQVTKTSLGADYNPTNRWTRGAADNVYWIGLEGTAPIGKKTRLRADVNYQRFGGDWTTANLAAPDINSAVAYPFPEQS
jgi:putative beta-barrel porin MtrB/PioB